MARLFLSPPHMTGNEQRYIAEVFESNYIAPLGPMVTRFEQAICDYTQAPFALGTSSGTAALHLALRVSGIGEGDIVLASSFTFIGSVAAILYQQATPLFIDAEAKSWNLSPELLETAIAQAPKMPKALIVTHLYGQCAEMRRIMAICRQHGIVVIEDAAESLGATLDGVHTGTWGDFGVYSFNGNKILSTSGGGMLVAKSGEAIAKAMFYATQAKEPTPWYEHKELGYNYRMSNVLAAIGVAQMEVLSERVTQRRRIFGWYKEALGEIDEITFMPELPDAQGNRWLTTLTLSHTDPERVRTALEARDIESRPLWKPMHLQPLFSGAAAVKDGTSEQLFSRGLCLPSGTQMTQEDVVRVSDIIRKVVV
ncbi:DegT/DnrJ/EryC1/StrS family aminotransferase [Thiomicrolovo sulfuroxydans]|uniref:DegT/DnrJ/EryC1/StrS family aminotransferase n=1 Tax=Thiomicrolovo sulfuroxydans TaxID=2894755 RepID=UPI0024C20993|nr:aminotransferase class V-fold PLP-dependent enzyme [Sulfurimonas sp. HSL-3221]